MNIGNMLAQFIFHASFAMQYNADLVMWPIVEGGYMTLFQLQRINVHMLILHWATLTNGPEDTRIRIEHGFHAHLSSSFK